MKEGLNETVYAAIKPALLFTILIALFASYTLDEKGLWWYFISSLAGGVTSMLIAVMISENAASATIRTAWKARLTLKYAHKVAHRTGMQVMFFACGLGIIVILCLFVCFENWYGEDDPTKLFYCS